ncbi:DUF4160 domain-containing protein [Sediminibacterium sp.]|uniref:DUF4160 domain-containing protein n=1 Tax=Sediminibacterium sp. TaxID=1917865 RepID=UPI0027375564|nr:DUF4160 domain-containing protein [Sediminibacterium sp.]MDP3393050.1 DUF4160 domain-containing protein [Sediminibacterium sp.]MDP3567258.1 DUF4160 domain-containing protein [Sediminibacterium sp.]
MPTILFVDGWRLFFYSNEGLEPIHIHAIKANMQCKYWIINETLEIKETFSFNLTPSERREIKKIIYSHFDLIIESWDKHFNK